MMTDFKDYLGNHFKGKMLHLKCNCIVNLDVTGLCIDYEKSSSELILVLDVNGKRIPVGSNTPKLQIEIL